VIRSRGFSTSFRGSVLSLKLETSNVTISGRQIATVITFPTADPDSDELIVEVDVILPQSSTLHFAHDVGETIQCVLER
jgi:hypothetical protein